MGPISPLDGIAELIRRKVAAEVTEKSGPQRANKTSESASGQQVKDKSDAELIKRKVIRQISAIDLDDPRRSHKAAQLFVENILTWQFGDELRNDPKFSALVDNVVEVLMREPAIIQQLNELK